MGNRDTDNMVGEMIEILMRYWRSYEILQFGWVEVDTQSLMGDLKQKGQAEV